MTEPTLLRDLMMDAKLVRDDLAYNFDAEHKPATFEALARLAAHAGKLFEAIRRIQNMHDEAAAYFAENDVPGRWLDADGSWVDWDSESEGAAAEAKRDALDAALDVLTILAHGGTPEQGSDPA